jgi:hypothetical protein
MLCAACFILHKIPSLRQPHFEIAASHKAEMAAFRTGVALVALLSTVCHARTHFGPPIGPYKLSGGVRQQLGAAQGEKPLVERCKERWRDTRLDHFT